MKHLKLKVALQTIPSKYWLFNSIILDCGSTHEIESNRLGESSDEN